MNSGGKLFIMKKIFLTMASIATGLGLASQAYANNYEIKSGDTLWSIAEENGTSVAELKQLNQLDDNEIKAGQRIIVSTNTYYRVQKGDTIAKITKKFSITTGELIKWNNLSSTKLPVGKQLIVSEKMYKKQKSKNRRSVKVALSPETAQLVKSIQSKQNKEEQMINEVNETTYLQDELMLDDTLELTSASDMTMSQNESEQIEYTTVDEQKRPSNIVDINNDVAKVALQIAQGKSYVYGANSANAVDCSSFAQQVFKALGKSIPRTTYAQMAAGKKVNDPQPGDLVFFNNGSHVGVYIGEGQMIDALNPEAGIGQRAVSYINGSVTGYYRY